jgi:hypothetical protein
VARTFSKRKRSFSTMLLGLPSFPSI